MGNAMGNWPEKLDEIWYQQIEYNRKVFEKQSRTSAEWMQTYLLGLISECGELLQEMNWKQHRLDYAEEFGPNVPEELADITKYVFSMWQIMGIRPDQMLQFLWDKGVMLEQKFQQEHRPRVQGKDVMLLDLDGVIADFRLGFENWIMRSERYAMELSPILEERMATLHMDINKGWSYPLYSQAKLQFEQGGGYAELPCIQTVVDAVKILQSKGFYLIIWTARPGRELERVWKDTWNWLQRFELQPDEFHFGGDERVADAIRLRREHNRVIALEDNPGLIQRYLTNDIPVFCIPQPYNAGLQEHPCLGSCSLDTVNLDQKIGSHFYSYYTVEESNG
jgi:NTP pyrophosphatase (non-canonical NTP hydrolase)